jgi:dynein heavy chain
LGGWSLLASAAEELCSCCEFHILAAAGAAAAVSSKFIDEFKMACSEADRSQLKLMMGHVHVYVTAACKEYFDKFRRHVYVTPKSYLSFIQGYKELYSRKWAYTQELAASIQVCTTV